MNKIALIVVFCMVKTVVIATEDNVVRYKPRCQYLQSDDCKYCAKGSLLTSSAGCLLAKGLGVLAGCCMDFSIKKACTFVWLGTQNCNSIRDCAISAPSIIGTAVIPIGLTVAACTYAPCCNKQWCAENCNKKNKNKSEYRDINLDNVDN